MSSVVERNHISRRRTTEFTVHAKPHSRKKQCAAWKQNVREISFVSFAARGVQVVRGNVEFSVEISLLLCIVGAEETNEI